MVVEAAVGAQGRGRQLADGADGLARARWMVGGGARRWQEGSASLIRTKRTSFMFFQFLVIRIKRNQCQSSRNNCLTL